MRKQYIFFSTNENQETLILDLIKLDQKSNEPDTKYVEKIPKAE